MSGMRTSRVMTIAVAAFGLGFLVARGLDPGLAEPARASPPDGRVVLPPIQPATGFRAPAPAATPLGPAAPSGPPSPVPTEDPYAG